MAKTPTPDHARRLSELRRSNAAGLHGSRPTRAEALREALRDQDAPRWERKALPRHLQLRVRHGSLDDEREGVTVRLAGQVVGYVVVPFHDDDWWSQGLPNLWRETLAHRIREAERAQFFGDDGDVLADERF